MTKSQWGEISFEGSYYPKMIEISLKGKCAEIQNTPPKNISINCALSSNLGTFNVTLPLDQYCFLPF